MEVKEETHNLIEQFKLLKSKQNSSETSLTDSVDVNHLLHKVIDYSLHDDNVLDKHLKYLKAPVLGKELFWGLGIENESYLMLDTYGDAEKFRKLKLKRERYSVDYYNNFDLDKVQDVFIKLYDCDKLRYPIYINAHTFQRTDVNWEHKTYIRVNSCKQFAIFETSKIIIRIFIYLERIFTRTIVFSLY